MKCLLSVFTNVHFQAIYKDNIPENAKILGRIIQSFLRNATTVTL